MFVVRVRVEIGADSRILEISFVVVHRKYGYRDFVLSKGLVRLKSARLLNEGFRFYPDAWLIRTN